MEGSRKCLGERCINVVERNEELKPPQASLAQLAP